MKHTTLLLIGAASCLALSGCATPEVDPTTDFVNKEPAVNAAASTGWECLKAPNELDIPGLVYRVDENGITNEVALLEMETREGTVANVAFSDRSKATAGMVAEILGISSSAASGGGSVGGSTLKQYDVELVLEDRKEHRANDMAVIAALRTLDTSIIDPSSKYYIIRDASTATAQKLRVSTDVAAGFGGEAAFETAVATSGSVQGGVSKENNQVYEINQVFDRPLTVCIKAQKFTPRVQEVAMVGTDTGEQIVTVPDENGNMVTRSITVPAVTRVETEVVFDLEDEFLDVSATAGADAS